MGNWPGISNHYYQNMCKVFLTLSEDVCVLCAVRSLWSVLGSVFEVFVCLSVTSVCVHVCARVNVCLFCETALLYEEKQAGNLEHNVL